MGEHAYLKLVIIAYFLGFTGICNVALAGSNPHSSRDQWIVAWGGKLDDYAYDLAISGDNIYITGRTKSFGAGDYDIFVLKFDLKGNLIWNTTWGGPNNEGAWAIAAYSDSVYVTGYEISTGVTFNVVLLKYDSDGNVLWNATIDASGYDVGRDIQVTDNGVFLTGESAEEAFLMKYDFEGQLQWNKTWSIPDGQVKGYRIWVRDDQIFVAGYYLTLGPDPNLFLTKFDIDGHQIWNTTWSEAGGPTPTGIAMDENGIYLAGIIKGTTGEREWDAILVKFDHLGHFQWFERWGGPKHENARKLIIDGDTLYIIGFTRSYGAGGADIFLLEYDQTGYLKSYSTWGEKGNESYPNFSIVDGTLYICGNTDSLGIEGYRFLDDGSRRKTYNVFLMKVTGSLAEFVPREEPTESGGVSGFPYESAIIGLIIGVLIIWQLKRRI